MDGKGVAVMAFDWIGRGRSITDESCTGVDQVVSRTCNIRLCLEQDEVEGGGAVPKCVVECRDVFPKCPRERVFDETGYALEVCHGVNYCHSCGDAGWAGVDEICKSKDLPVRGGSMYVR